MKDTYFFWKKRDETSFAFFFAILLGWVAADRLKGEEPVHRAAARNAASDYAEAELVIQGKQLRTEVLKTNEGFATVRVEVEVQDVFKGKAVTGEVISFIATPDADLAPFDSGSFEPNTEWAIFLKVKPMLGDFEFLELSNSNISMKQQPTALLRALETAWKAYEDVPEQFGVVDEQG